MSELFDIRRANAGDCEALVSFNQAMARQEPQSRRELNPGQDQPTLPKGFGHGGADAETGIQISQLGQAIRVLMGADH